MPEPVSAPIFVLGALRRSLRPGKAPHFHDRLYLSFRGAEQASAVGALVLGHPEKLLDFCWRSEHEMIVTAKAVLQAFYGTAARRSYWNDARREAGNG